MVEDIKKYWEEYELEVIEARKKFQDWHIDKTEYSKEVLKCLKRYQKNIWLITNE